MNDPEVAFDFTTIWIAFEFANSSSSESMAYLDRVTGDSIFVSDVEDTLDEIPDDIGSNERYVELPAKKELDLGSSLPLRFARETDASVYDEVRVIFRRSKAYRNFKALLDR